MEAATENEKDKKLETEKKGKQKFLRGFWSFLAMGGFIVILIVILGIVILIERLTK